MAKLSINEYFRRVSVKVSEWSGHPSAFVIACSIIIIWLLTGPIFQYSDTWQLVINTATTVSEFVMIFVLQNTQNRDTLTMQLKLDELLRAIREARNTLVNLEEMSDEEIKALQKEFRELHDRAESALKKRNGNGE